MQHSKASQDGTPQPQQPTSGGAPPCSPRLQLKRKRDDISPDKFNPEKRGRTGPAEKDSQKESSKVGSCNT